MGYGERRGHARQSVPLQQQQFCNPTDSFAFSGGSPTAMGLQDMLLERYGIPVRLITPRNCIIVAALSGCLTWSACSSGEPCRSSLAEACDPCPTFDERIDDAFLALSERDSAIALRCADGTQVVDYDRGWIAHQSDYFNSSGVQVARTYTSDNPEKCGNTTHYGDVPECSPECYVRAACEGVEGDSSCTELDECP